MKLSAKQLDRLRQSATNPGRPTPEIAPETVAPAGPPPDPAENVVRALQDALWAIEHAESKAPSADDEVLAPAGPRFMDLPQVEPPQLGDPPANPPLPPE